MTDHAATGPLTGPRTPTHAPRRAGRPRQSELSSGPESRERILSAAAKLFVALGYSATTTRDIAAAVGIRQASLFHHFARKEEILVELIDRSLDGILDVSRWMAPNEPAPDVALWTLIRHDTETLCSDPLNLGALIRLPEVRVPAFDPIWRKRGELAQAYRWCVQAGIDGGQFRAGDPALITNLLFSLSEGTIDWYERGGSLLPVDVACEVADGALRMILVAPARVPQISQQGRDLLTAFRSRR